MKGYTMSDTHVPKKRDLPCIHCGSDWHNSDECKYHYDLSPLNEEQTHKVYLDDKQRSNVKVKPKGRQKRRKSDQPYFFKW
ncbi:hypothetical protein ACFL1P_01810 [Patescibacteria group bacterium]